MITTISYRGGAVGGRVVMNGLRQWRTVLGAEVALLTSFVLLYIFVYFHNIVTTSLSLFIVNNNFSYFVQIIAHIKQNSFL